MISQIENRLAGVPGFSNVGERASKRQLSIGAGLIFLLSLGYLALWWNRYFPANSAEGVWVSLAKLMAEGQIPYRDFTLVVPPLHLFKTAAVMWLFGDQFTMIRAFAVLERAFTHVLLFLWLARVFPAPRALLCSFVGLAVTCNVSSDPISDYVYSSAFFAIASGYLASRALDRGWRKGHTFLSGLAAGLCLLERQNVGLFVIALVGLASVVLALRRNGWRVAVRTGLAFGAGAAAPLAALLLWLWRYGAAGLFLDLVFLKGPSAKGDPATMLLRPFRFMVMGRYNTYRTVFSLGVIAAILAAPLILRRGKQEILAGRFRTVAVLIVLAILAGIGLSSWPALLAESPLVYPVMATVIILSFCAACVVLLFYSARAVFAGVDITTAQIVVLAAAGFAIAYGNSLSWLSESTYAVALPLVIALAFGIFSRVAGGKLLQFGLVAACCYLIAASAFYKQVKPFSWYGWREPPVRTATVEPRIESLRGMRISADTASALERLVDLIRTHSGPDDTVVAHPYFPSLYALSERRPAMRSPASFRDVMPDFLVPSEMERVERARPAVVVYFVSSPEEESELAREFGASDAGRDKLYAAIRQITDEYTLVGTVLTSGYKLPIQVYARPDKVSR